MAWDNRTHGADYWSAAHDDKWAINADDDYTIAAFIKVTDSSADKMLIIHGSLGAYWYIRLEANNVIRVVIRDADTLFVQESTFTFTDDALHLIVVRVKNSTLDVDLFLDDGAPENYAMGDTINADNAGALTIGRIQGNVYWMAMWDTALSDAQIKGLYAGGVPVLRLPAATNWSDLVMYHECNDQAGGTTGSTGMTITDVSQYQTIFTANYTPDFIGGPYATLGAGPLSVLAVAAAAAGGPFPHYTRRRMRGGLIGMGV